jgi:hypothetical protein
MPKHISKQKLIDITNKYQEQCDYYKKKYNAKDDSSFADITAQLIDSLRRAYSFFESDDPDSWQEIRIDFLYELQALRTYFAILRQYKEYQEIETKYTDKDNRFFKESRKFTAPHYVHYSMHKLRYLKNIEDIITQEKQDIKEEKQKYINLK